MGMVNTRQDLIGIVGHSLQMACIIATRYAVCRKQFSNQDGTKEERRLLDYQTHMWKIGGLLADAFMMQINAKQSAKLLKETKQEMSQGKFESLEMMHHMTSGLKGFYCL